MGILLNIFSYLGNSYTNRKVCQGLGDALGSVKPPHLWRIGATIAAVMYVQNIVSDYFGRWRIPSGDDLGLSFPLFVTNQLLGVVATVAQIAGALGLVAPKGSYFVGDRKSVV